MKKLYTLFVLILFVSALQSQELPNSGFETWENFGTYDEPESWHTPNPFTSLIGAVTVTKSEESAAGQYSAKLENVLIELGPLKYNVPGLVTYADFVVDFASGDFNFSGGLYMPFKVYSINGKYKYSPAENDTATVIIYSFSHPEEEEMDTIGTGFGFLGGASDWTDFNVPMIPLNDRLPDTFNVLITSSNSIDTDSIPVGSVLLIDDLSIETNVGIFSLPDRKIDVSVFPNPATDRLTFETAENSNNRNLRIFDINGREVKNISFNTQKLTVEINDLSEGHYSYLVQEKQDLIGTGSFIKK